MRPPGSSLHLAALWLVTLGASCNGAACGGDQGTSVAVTVVPGPIDLPARTAAESEDVRDLVTDLVAGRICDEIRGTFHALHGSARRSAADREPIAGRLWLEDCQVRRHPDAIGLRIHARGWRWIDREIEQLGARFAIDQYVRFAAELGGSLTADLAYDRDQHRIYLWLTPSEPLRVAVEPIGEIEVRRPEAWSAVLGWAAEVFPGASLEARAREQLSRQSSRRIASRLAGGYTLIVDLCTGARHLGLGAVEEGQVPEELAREREHAWLQDLRVRLHPGGIDVAGPFPAGARSLRAEIEVRGGPGVHAEVLCRSEAEKVVDAFVSGAPLPEVRPRARARARAGAPATLRATADCDLAIITRPVSARAPVLYQLRVARAGAAEAPEGVLACARGDAAGKRARQRSRRGQGGAGAAH